MKDPCRESTEVTPMKILLCIAISSKSQNNFLESHVWSQISGKPVEEKNLKFFESGLEFLYFDMLKNEGRGSSNRLGVKKSFVTQNRAIPK